ncbi:MAG TPA: glycosyltransferase family 39 protein [Candidatus Omnitrophota bacterium]|nr:glycosyltransferase family 39 protein [Candidatus Omnitrophota bacterium]
MEKHEFNRMTVLLRLLAAAIFIVLFLTFAVSFRGPDEPIYYAFTASIVDDGDLNVVDQLHSEPGPFEVTSTYHHSDFHNHGGVIFWAPFYIYGKIVNTLRGPDDGARDGPGPEGVMKAVMSLSTVLMSFMNLLLIFLLVRKFFSIGTAFLAVCAVFWATPYFFFTLVETANAQIPASLLATLLLCVSYTVVGTRIRDWFWYGVFFSVCIVTKLDLWFYIFFVGAYYYMLRRRHRVRGSHAAAFAAGALPCIVMKIVNDFVQYGMVRQAEFSLLSSRSFYLFEQLFSRYRGYAYTSPILLVCLLGAVISFMRSARTAEGQPVKLYYRDRFIAMTGLLIILKIVIIAFRYAWGGGTPGPRVLLTDSCILALLIGYVVSIAPRPARIWLWILAGMAAAWNCLIIAEYYTGSDLYYIVSAPGVLQRLRVIPAFMSEVMRIKEPAMKFFYLAPASVLAAAGVWSFGRIRNGRIIDRPWYRMSSRPSGYWRIFAALTALMVFSYAAVTVSNCARQAENVQRLRDSGFFAQARILRHEDFERFENEGSLKEMIWYFSTIGDDRRVRHLREIKRTLYGD